MFPGVQHEQFFSKAHTGKQNVSQAGTRAEPHQAGGFERGLTLPTQAAQSAVDAAIPISMRGPLDNETSAVPQVWDKGHHLQGTIRGGLTKASSNQNITPTCRVTLS